jgi:hypothetical protein
MDMTAQVNARLDRLSRNDQSLQSSNPFIGAHFSG